MPMTWGERKERLEQGALTRIAQEVGVTPNHVSRVNLDDWRPKTRAGRESTMRIRRLIAREMGVSVDQAFPPLPTSKAPRLREVSPATRRAA